MAKDNDLVLVKTCSQLFSDFDSILGHLVAQLYKTCNENDRPPSLAQCRARALQADLQRFTPDYGSITDPE